MSDITRGIGDIQVHMIQALNFRRQQSSQIDKYMANNHTEECSSINKFQWEHAACKWLPEGESYQRLRHEHEEKQNKQKQ